MSRLLHELLLTQARRTPDAPAVVAPDGRLGYAELDAASNRAARVLRSLGVRQGDRVALWLEKSTRGVAAMQGVLRLGAAYVPLDPLSPAARAQRILRDCGVRALITTEERLRLLDPDALTGASTLTLEGGAASAGWRDVEGASSDPLDAPALDADALAYILYTSGSTGQPKGVSISHRNALAFVDWAVAEVGLEARDRVANHAPFHFDLSVFDLYGALAVGAQVSILPEGASFAPRRLVDFIRDEGITVWYSVPSALVLMMEHGELLQADRIAWRAVLFAGEVFPVKHLRLLRRRWPGVRLLNLYGPTETNVCTWHEVRDVPEGAPPVPIGVACCGDRVWAVRSDGTLAGPGDEGELLVEGPTVMLGYWGRPPQDGRPYATGDLVRQTEAGEYVYVGRRDHMVKVRGHRIELGEVEAALLEHPDVREAAVVVAGAGTEARLVAFLVARRQPAPSLVGLKGHCAERLPRYMIIDRARWLMDMPRTANGKVDRVRLAADAAGDGPPPGGAGLR